MKSRYTFTYGVIIIGFLIISPFSFAQHLPEVLPQTPRVATMFQPSVVNTSNNYRQPKSQNIVYTTRNTNKRNQLLINEVDKQIAQQIQLQRRQQSLINEAVNEFNPNNSSNYNYKLPSKAHIKGTEIYRQAYKELSEMNPDNFSLKRATFIIENAFYGNTKNYNEFENYIQNSAKFIKRAIQEQDLDIDDNIVKNLNIYQFISDTLSVGNNKHLPYKYDFNDYWGREDWSKMFVQKLINEGSGQCSSLPRYYLILAEEMKAKSSLAFAPNHSFIKFKDHKGDWYNAELTSGVLMSDALVVTSGFVKSEAIFNGGYAQAQTSRQLMAQILNDLGAGYDSKFGLDNFIKEVIDKSLELNPNGISGNLYKFNYLNRRLEYFAKKLQIQSQEQLRQNPEVMKMVVEANQQDQKIKDIGYERISKKDYEQWLKSLEKHKKEQTEKSKQELMQGVIQQQKQFKD